MRVLLTTLVLLLGSAPAAGAAWIQGAEDVEVTVLRAVDSQRALAGGPGGSLLQTTDAGATWTRLPGPGTNPLRALAALADGIFTVDSRGNLRRSADAGGTWSDIRNGVAAVASLGDRVVVAGRRSLLLSTDAGAGFDDVTPELARGDALTALDTGGNSVVASGPRTLLVSADRGRTWRHLRLPPFARGDAVFGVDFVAPRVGFVLTSSRRLFRTRNAGHDWHELLGTGGAGAALAFTDARRGWLAAPGFAGRYDGTVMRTTDGGATWRPETVAPRFLSAVAAAGATAFAIGNEGSALFANGGDSRRAQVDVGFRVIRRGRNVTVRGRITPASAQRPVVVSTRIGASRWLSREVARDRDGVFTMRFRLTRTTWVVAQALGDAEHTGAGTNPVRVRVRR